MKKKLEEIKEKYSKAEIMEHINGIDIIAADKSDIDWFIERAEELEKRVTENRIAFMVTVEEMIKFAKRNDRYREALEEIEVASYWDYGEEFMHQELQSIARQALEEST